MIEDYRKARLNKEHRTGTLMKHLPLLLTVKNLSETHCRRELTLVGHLG